MGTLHPLLRGKFDRLCRGAAGIIAANDFLLEKAVALNPRCCKVPTAVDLAAYPPPEEKRRTSDGKMTAVWIGTPVTFPFLLELAPVLRQAADRIRLLVVGGGAVVPGLECTVVPWAEADEAKILASADCGLMPLPDTPFTRGKSSYKLLQYFAAGLPVIASPVGENRSVVTPECGFLADSPEEWLDAFARLAESETRLRLAAGAAIRARDFALSLHGPRAADFIASSLKR